MCPFQQLMSYKTHEENKRKIGQEGSSMQLAHYQCHRPTPWMQESVSMHKSPTPVRHSRMNQARSEEKRKKIGVIRRLMERKAAQQKHIGGTKTRPTKAQLRCTKGRSAKLSLATECDPLPPTNIKAKEIFSFTVLAKFSTYTWHLRYKVSHRVAISILLKLSVK